MTTAWARAAGASSLILASCVGQIGDSGPGSGEDGSKSPDAEAIAELGAGDLLRLSDYEYENALRDLFGDEAIAAVTLQLDGVPDDRRDDAFSSMVVGVSSVHVDAYYAVADALSDFYATDPARLAPIEGCFAEPDFGRSCVEDLVTSFGSRVYRRPLTESQAEGLLALYDEGAALSTADGVRAVLLYMLQAPSFLYRLELAGEDLGDGGFALDEYELAARLSFLAWGTTPDAELLAAADDAQLSTEEGLAAQVDRLLASPRAEAHLARFFGEWLGIDRLPGVQQPQDFLAGIDPDGLTEAMEAELQQYVLHHVFAEPGTWADVLTSQVGFPSTDALAEVYELTGPSDDAVELSPLRRGLLTRAGMLAGQGVETHPIIRGAHVRKQLLCETIAPPDPSTLPAGEKVEPPAFDPNKTARERWTEKTSAPACAGCHEAINPVGFALEGFDNIGRARTLEPIIEPATGEIVNELPIDTEVSITIDASGPFTTADAASLGQAIADSDVAEACFARQWFRFGLGRSEGALEDATIDAMVADGDLLIDILRGLTRTPAFRLRKVPQ